MMLVVLLTFLAGAFALQDTCGRNEQYNECGTLRPLTCDNQHDPSEMSTTTICMKGCECKSGFLRTSDGRCVSPEQCPNKSRIKRQSYDLTFDVRARKFFYEECGTSSGRKKREDECSHVCQKRFKRQTSNTKVVIDTNDYIYGGCGGSGRRYKREADCLADCSRK